MKGILFVGGLLASVAGAGADEVRWSLAGPTQVPQGSVLTWQAAVQVVGTSQGLAGYAFTLALGPGTGPTAGPDGIWGSLDDENLSPMTLAPATWVKSFKVGGSQTGSLIDNRGQGGPGMGVLPSVGTSDVRQGELIQVGAGHLFWDPAVAAAGVGLDGAKAALLGSTSATYTLHSGTIPTAGLAPGSYTLRLVPLKSRVLRGDLNLNSPQPGFLMEEATGVEAVLQFTITPVIIPGDFDRNGRVDAADMDRLIQCATGPAVGYQPVVEVVRPMVSRGLTRPA